MANQAKSSSCSPPMTPPSPSPPFPAIHEDNRSMEVILYVGSPPTMSNGANGAAYRWRSPPMTPPPSPAIPEDYSSEMILWAASGNYPSITPRTDLLSLWQSNYAAAAQPAQPEHEEEPLANVTLLNFESKSSLLDLVDLNTTGAFGYPTLAPDITRRLCVQLVPAAGPAEDQSRLAMELESRMTSISPLTLGIQNFQVSSPVETSAQLCSGIPSLQSSFGIQTALAPFSSLPPILYPWPMAPPLWNEQLMPCPLPVQPPLWDFLPTYPPSRPERRRSWSELWCELPSTPTRSPPATGPLFLPLSTLARASSDASRVSHQTRNFFPGANTSYQKQGYTHVPATFPTPSANASRCEGLEPASRRPPRSLAMAPPNQSRISGGQDMPPCPRHARFSPRAPLFATPNQPRISRGQDMRPPCPRHARFLPSARPPPATNPAPPWLLANVGSSVPGWAPKAGSSRASGKSSMLAVRKKKSKGTGRAQHVL